MATIARICFHGYENSHNGQKTHSSRINRNCLFFNNEYLTSDCYIISKNENNLLINDIGDIGNTTISYLIEIISLSIKVIILEITFYNMTSFSIMSID